MTTTARLLSIGLDRESHVPARRASVTVGLVCSLVAWVTVGTGGLISGLLAAVVAVAFFWSGRIPLFIVRESGAGALAGLGLLLLTYTTRLGLVLMTLQLPSMVDALDGRTIGVTIVASSLTWISVHLAASVRRRGADPGEQGPDFVADDAPRSI